jgi:S1-C subfamily serine protease
MFRWTALALAFVTVTAGNCYGALVPDSQIAYNNWRGAAYTNDQVGGFSHCAVYSTYVGGVTLTFAVNASNAVTIGFMRADWTFKTGQAIRGNIRIDQRYSARVTGVAIGPQMIKVDFPPTDPIFGHLAHGYVMTISSEAGPATFNLVDSFRALELARKCAAKFQAKLGIATARPNQELQNWMARNPWFSDPQFAEQARAALAVDAQMRAEGKDGTTADYYVELDERLRKAGIGPAPPATQPAAATSRPPAPPKKTPKTVEVSGTGFVVATDGYVVTNNHVVAGCVSDVHASLSGESAVDLRIVSRDDTNDLALLRAGTKFADAVPVRGTAIRPGDGVVAIGYPYYGMLSTDLTITNGIVSSLGGIGNDSRYLQISAPIQPGNSGGPLLDTSGNLVGVVSEKLDTIKVAEATGTIPENVNFAIKTGIFRDFLDKNVVTYIVANPGSELDLANIARRARSYTLRIWCTAKPES